MKDVDLTNEDLVYISGPMRGKPMFNFIAFNSMEKFLRDVFGCKVFNPADNEPGLTYDQYIVLDLTMVRLSTAIVLLNGWEKSEGSTLERYEAKIHGLKIYTEQELRID